MSHWDWRRLLKIWGLPLAGIASMVLLARLFEVVHFFLFAHHLFWIFAVILLLNPLSDTFWPSPALKKRILPQPSAKVRARAEVRKLMEKHKHPSVSASPAERLARLLKEKEVVDQKISKLSS